ncbi:hypothetical protein [Thermoflavimicrobium dichotomicum]|uniref:Uncharacterized protein n=1 Tax=Thermoflavimicrobium dichotomicum TaxID=46223 RepID=A0A1I3TK02_9BACL|nr:hypothetical protein [Thermoflavimicrobium dichotomicum]SFJ70882.1 hypothetical protein SAMN05421852_1189 [Thermoflavimicrobium dichotomicum]
MRWVELLSITVLVVLISGYHWKKIKENERKDKVTFAVLIGVGWILFVLLIFFPDMPGPTQLIQTIFQPLGKLLEK